MATSLNEVRLIGNIGGDAEIKPIPNGTLVAKFSLATTESLKKGEGQFEDKTTWHKVVLWRPSEYVQNNLVKGKQVCVLGKIDNRKYENSEGKTIYISEVIADRVLLLGGRSDNGTAKTNGEPTTELKGSHRGGSDFNTNTGIVVDSDIPF